MREYRVVTNDGGRSERAGRSVALRIANQTRSSGYIGLRVGSTFLLVEKIALGPNQDSGAMAIKVRRLVQVPPHKGEE